MGMHVDDVSPRDDNTVSIFNRDYQSVSGKALCCALAADGNRAYLGGHSGHPEGNMGLVEFALESRGEGTALAVRHTYPSRPEYEAIAGKYGSAWPRALARLEALLATLSDREGA